MVEAEPSATQAAVVALIERADALIEADQLAMADALLQSVLAYAVEAQLPEHAARARFQWARVAYAENDFDAALTRAWRALTRSSDPAVREQALVAVGGWCVELGHYAGARDAFEVCVAQAATPSVGASARIGLLELAGVDGRELDVERIRRSLQPIGSLTPDVRAAYHLESGRAYRALDKTALARSEFELAVSAAQLAGVETVRIQAETALSDLREGRRMKPRPSRPATPAVDGVLCALREMRELVGSLDQDRDRARSRPTTLRGMPHPIEHLRACVARVANAPPAPAAPAVLRSAVASLRTALDEEADVTRLWIAANAYGEALITLQQIEAAAAWYGGMVPLLSAAGEPSASGWASVSYADALRTAARLREAGAAYVQARQIADQAVDRRLSIAAAHGETLLLVAVDPSAAARILDNLIDEADQERWRERVAALLADRADIEFELARHAPPIRRTDALVEAMRLLYRAVVVARDVRSQVALTRALMALAAGCVEVGLAADAQLAYETIVRLSPPGSVPRHTAACALLDLAGRQRDESAFQHWRALLERASLPPALRVAVLTALGTGLRVFGSEEDGTRVLVAAEAFATVAASDAVQAVRAPRRPVIESDPPMTPMRSTVESTGWEATVRAVSHLISALHSEAAVSLDAVSAGAAFLTVARSARPSGNSSDAGLVAEIRQRVNPATLPEVVAGRLPELERAVMQVTRDQMPIHTVHAAVDAYTDALFAAGLFAESTPWFDAVEALATAYREPELAAAALLGRATAANHLARFADASELARTALTLGNSMQHDDIQLQARHILAWAEFRSGNLTTGLELLEALIADAERLGVSARLVPALTERAAILTDIALVTTDPVRRRAVLTASATSGYELLARWHRDAPADRRPLVLINIGEALMQLGLRAAAEDAFAVAAAQATRTDVWQCAMLNQLELAALRGDRGAFDRFRRQLQAAALTAQFQVALLLQVGSGLSSFGDTGQGRKALLAAQALAELYGLRGHSMRIERALNGETNAPGLAMAGEECQRVADGLGELRRTIVAPHELVPV